MTHIYHIGKRWGEFHCLIKYTLVITSICCSLPNTNYRSMSRHWAPFDSRIFCRNFNYSPITERIYGYAATKQQKCQIVGHIKLNFPTRYFDHNVVVMFILLLLLLVLLIGTFSVCLYIVVYWTIRNLIVFSLASTNWSTIQFHNKSQSQYVCWTDTPLRVRIERQLNVMCVG